MTGDLLGGAMSRRSIIDSNSGFSYGRAVTADETLAVYDLREEIWKESFPYLLGNPGGGHPAKDSFDDHSYIYYSSDETGVIGSCRGSPMVAGLWEISSSLPPDIHLRYNPETTLQLDKVYIRDGYRNICLHEFLFFNFSNWIVQNTNYSKYFAICNVELVRLYRRLGVDLAMPDGFSLKGRASHQYYLLEGDIRKCRDVIGKRFSLGMECA